MSAREQAVRLINNLSEEQISKFLEFVTSIQQSDARQQGERKSARGIAHKYADPSLIPAEEGAWEHAAVQKHEERFGEKRDNS